MKLKPRQLEAQAAIFAALDRGISRQLVSLPTGVGKTCLACHVARHFQSVLFLVHRAELVEQTTLTMTRIDPTIPIGFIRPGEHRIAKFTLGMIQTVHNRLNRIAPDTFDLVVLDEAHHSTARTWRTVADYFTPRLRLGLSATPQRADGADLSNLFDQIVYRLPLSDAITEGYLVPPRCVQISTTTSLDRVRTTAGDFNEGDLQRVLNTPERNKIVINGYRAHGDNRRAVCFTAGVQHAQDLSTAFNEAGIAADWVSGADPNRADKINRFAAGEITVLSNAMVLTEGFDDPAIGAVLMARPTQSRGLFVQMVGRGLRLHPNKSECVLLDFVDTAHRHSLISAWQFFGRATGNAGESVSGNQRMDEAIGRATEITGHKPDLIIIERLLDILKPPPDLDNFTYGNAQWHYTAASEKQLAMLASVGYDVAATDWTRGQASAVIGSLPASVKQVQLLLAMGFDVLTQHWTRQQASLAIEDAKESGVTPDWQRLKPEKRISQMDYSG